MKITAEHLLPLLLDYVNEYFGAEDCAQFQEYFKIAQSDFKKDVLVAQGGLKHIVEQYFKHNKPAYKKFSKAVKSTSAKKEEKPTKKRTRAQSG